MRFWLLAWNIELTLVPSLHMKPQKYSARKYVWHCFWKGKWSWWDSKQNECLWWSSRPKGSLKEMLWEISQNSQENVCAGISFLVIPCEFCGICKISQNTFFYKEFQWMLLRFNLCFRRNLEQKQMLLSAINTRFSWKKDISCRKNPEAATVGIL